MPAAPWSVPRAVLLGAAAELRPDVRRARGRRARAPRGRAGRRAASARVSLRPSASVCGLVGVRVVAAGRASSATQCSGRPAREHRREAGEPAREAVVVVRVGDRAAVAGSPFWPNGASCSAEPVGLRGRLGAPGSGPGRRAARAERAERRRASGLDRRPRRRAPRSRSSSGASSAATGTFVGRERRARAVVEREALQRVVGRADEVEVAAEPAGREPRVVRADLPEVARGEVRLVGVVVADRRAARVTLPSPCSVASGARDGCQRRRGVLGERGPGVGRARASGAACGSAGRRPGRAPRARRRRRRGRPRRAPAAPGRRRRLRDALLEAPRRELPRAVDGEREPGARADERCAGRARCPPAAASPARSPAARGRPRRPRAAASAARVKSSQWWQCGHQLVWRSGETAISWRSAFWRSAAGTAPSSSRRSRRASACRANACSSPRVVGA